MQRNRLVYGGWIVVVIAMGLVSRSGWGREFLAVFVREYAGDALWALMVFLGLGFLFPRVEIWKIAAGALGISFGVEVSQLYHAEWIDGIRATRMGGLVLGRGWVATDLICYAVGVAVGVVGEKFAGLKCSAFREGGRLPSDRSDQ
ncbi:ribosomal maturation YjgA family protein [Luteolibacter soli]|uniref:ribosomal maturation YjgA family protein n=1 Tax=Luteolibacter soli TaxID=3135280 RepID=UPI0031F451C9